MYAKVSLLFNALYAKCSHCSLLYIQTALPRRMGESAVLLVFSGLILASLTCHLLQISQSYICTALYAKCPYFHLCALYAIFRLRCALTSGARADVDTPRLLV